MQGLLSLSPPSPSLSRDSLFIFFVIFSENPKMKEKKEEERRMGGLGWGWGGVGVGWGEEDARTPLSLLSSLFVSS
jgi:hypothetical protein